METLRPAPIASRQALAPHAVAGIDRHLRAPAQFSVLVTSSSGRIVGGMGALEKWTELLRCPNCAVTGTADLAQEGRGIVKTVRLPAGFKAVPSEYGDTFYCKACNLPARTTLK